MMSINSLINSFISRIRHEYNPYNDYCDNIEKKSMNLAAGNILITIINGAYGHLFEGVYARKASLNGYTPYILRCGGYLEYCDANPQLLKHRRIRCLRCRAKQEDFIRAFGGVDCSYSNYVSAEDEKIIQEAIKSYISGGLESFKQVHIRPILYTALQRFYLIADPEIKNDKITRGFLKTIFSTLIVMERLCNEIKPKYVMSSHGTYSTWGSIVEYCKAHNIYVITYGQNYNQCGQEFTYNDSYLTGDLNDKENDWANKDLTDKEKARVKRFLDERLGRVSDDNVAFDYNKNNKDHYSKEQICNMLGINHAHKLVGVFPNIPWDGSVTGGSVVFEKYRDWLRATVEIFKEKKNVELIFRAHPAEVNVGTDAGRESTASILYELFSQLPKNVHVLEPRHKINSYTLAENCDFAITYSSTVSLELTYLGVPVILCGCPPFKDKNVVFDITSFEDYKKMIDRGLEKELVVTDERKERLFRYLHYFFFMRTMPQTLVKIKDTVPQGFNFTTEEELDADPVFDDMFKKINNQEPMDFSKFYN